MKETYELYSGKIVRIHKKGREKTHADLVGRVSGENLASFELGKNTFYNKGDTDGIVASRIRIAEMGYHIYHNLVFDLGFVDKEEIETIKVLAEN